MLNHNGKSLFFSQHRMLTKEPWIPEYGPPKHHSISTGFRDFFSRVRHIKRVTIAENKCLASTASQSPSYRSGTPFALSADGALKVLRSSKCSLLPLFSHHPVSKTRHPSSGRRGGGRGGGKEALSNFHGPFYPLPARGHERHLLSCARVNDDCGRLLGEKFRKPRFKLVFVVAKARLDRNRQSLGSFLCGTNQFAREFGVLDKRGSGALLLHLFVGTTHINVDAVKTEFLGELRGFAHLLRLAGKKLGNDRPLRFAIHQIDKQFLSPRATESIGGNKLGKHDIGLAVLRDDAPKSCVGDIGHRRENHNGFRQFLPKS